MNGCFQKKNDRSPTKGSPEGSSAAVYLQEGHDHDTGTVLGWGDRLDGEKDLQTHLAILEIQTFTISSHEVSFDCPE